MSDQVPHHHPDTELLLDYAAGSLAEPLSLLVATHLALCPDCRQQCRELEGLGGALLAAGEGAPVSDSARSRVMAACCDESAPIEVAGAPAEGARPASAAVPAAQEPRVPEPLRTYLGRPLDELGWKRLYRGFEELDLNFGRSDCQTKMLRIAPGRGAPQHTHGGREATLIVCGAYRDETGYFGRGDVAVHDSEVDHRPVAEPGEPCVCLTVIEAPLRLTGPVGRFFNRFMRF